MPCENHREALTEGAASGAELQSAARTHLESCAPCRAFFAEEQALFGAIDTGVRAAANADVPPDFLPRVRVGLTGESAPRRRWILAPATLACAAVLLIAVLAVSMSRRAEPSRPTTPVENVRNVAPPEVVQPREKSSVKTTAAMAMAVTRRHAFSPRATKWEEPLVLVPAGQREAVELLMASLRRGEIKGDVLVANGNDPDPQLPPISPIDIIPLRIKPLEIATRELR